MQIAKILLCYALAAILLCACSPADTASIAEMTTHTDSSELAQYDDIQSRIDGGESVTQEELDLLTQQETDNQVRFERGTIADLSLNGQGVLLLTTSGEMISWGNNECGIAGIGAVGAVHSPQKIPLDAVITQIDTAAASGAAVSQSGKVYLWGNNDFGIFGTGDYQNSSQPVSVPLDQTAKNVTISSRLSTIITETGEVYGCGSNFTAPDILESPTKEELQKMSRATFAKIELPEPIQQTATALQFRAFLSENGTVFFQGKIGEYGDSETSLEEIRTAAYPEKIVKIDCNSELLIALGESGNLYGCGGDNWGLVSGEGASYRIPTAFGNLTQVSDFSVGSSGILALTKDNRLFAWGYNGFAQIPTDSPDIIFQPTEIDPQETNVKQFFSGFTTSALITQSGDVFLWGGNFDGQKLNGNRVSSFALSKITSQ